MNRCRLNTVALLGSVVIGAGATAVAADGPSADAGVLQEVLVTAQKRVENLQEVPIAITAIDARALEVQGVTDTDSFAKSVPNLHIKQGTTGVITIAIRGVSNNDPGNPGFENAVGMYLDGVYAGKAVNSLFDLDDVERVEVLRGPQGTLYGRNTIGGAVNFISKRPSGELRTTVKLGLGNEDLRTANISVDLPAIGTADEGLGTLKARLSYFLRQRDGFTRNVQQNFVATARPIAPFERFGDVDRQGVHAAFDWQPRSPVLVSYDYTRFKADDHQRLMQVIDVVRPGTMPAGFESYIPSGQPSVGSANENPYFETASDTHSLIIGWELSDTLTLKSITGYRRMESLDGQDFDGSNVSYYESKRDYDGTQRSEEVQLVGSTRQLKYVLGLFWFDEEIDSLRVQQFTNATFERDNNSYLDNSNKAIFGQIDYTPAALERLTVTVGARYTEEKKDMARYLRNWLGGTGTFQIRDPGPNLLLPTLKFSNTSFMLSPSYRVTDDLNVYFRYAEGFRSGGYDGQASSAASAAVPFKSEKLKSYEAGMKSRWLDNRLELNAAAFYSDYTDMQLTSFTGTVSATLNAGKASIDGAELEAAAVLSERLRANLSLAYLHYKFDRFDLGPVIGDVASRARLNNAPRYSGNLGVDYDFPSLGFGDLSLHVNYNYQASAEAIAIKTNGDAPNSRLSPRGLLDAHLALSRAMRGERAKLQFTLWGMNLTDREYFDNVIDFGGFRAGTLGWPRTYGASVAVTF
ncbi:MAG: TonB-dependent receptor [Gammaproteobacteria bacterium]|nr:TonB-dependent receptor [Gammaproteobacteria bacterium]